MLVKLAAGLLQGGKLEIGNLRLSNFESFILRIVQLSKCPFFLELQLGGFIIFLR